MSWAAHQFEVYAVEAHLPEKMVGQVSWFAIFFGDFTPDFLAKFWVYGITINGHHFGASKPDQWHRGWPGMGISHTLFFGALVTIGIWAWKHNRAWTIGYLLGFAAHVLTDVNDSVGTMLMFPFSTLNWSLHTWAYAATVQGGKYLDAASYYSSLGLVMDVFWLVVVLVSWRCLTREFWRTNVVPGDPYVWSWLGQWFDDRGLLGDLSQRLLLRRVPDDRVEHVGARCRPAGDRRRRPPRLSVRSVLERAVVGQARDPAPRHAAGRACRRR